MTPARAICRRQRPHPGAQLTFTDAAGEPASHDFLFFVERERTEQLRCLVKCPQVADGL